MRPVWSSVADIVIEIRRDMDVIVARGEAQRLAKDLGLPRRAQWEIAIAVSEAATNILKYAGEGTITLRQLAGPATGLEFSALDQGAGIDSIPEAMADGISQGRDINQIEFISERRGLGFGLGAISRLMDDVTIANRPQGGVELTARKFLSKATTS